VPLVDLKRITSGTNTQVDSTSRENAIQKAIHKVTLSIGTQDAVIIGNAPGGIWPVLSTYENDTSGGIAFEEFLFVAPPPQFIWDDNTFGQGEIRYFAVALRVGSVEEHVIAVTTFADNAHRLFVEERNIFGDHVASFTPEGGLFDGPVTANASENEDKAAPFNWQKIHIWSSDDIRPDSLSNFFVFSWEVINYKTTDTINPAGLAFQIDIYRYIQPVA
jgi:hypothetical protein